MPVRLPRLFFVIGVFAILGSTLPVPKTTPLRNSLAGALEGPLLVSRSLAVWVNDLLHFRQNARESKLLREEIGRMRQMRLDTQELLWENARLRHWLQLKDQMPASLRGRILARVLGRSPLTWNRTFLIDKGMRDQIRVNMLVLSGEAVVGKVIESGASVSKVQLLSDPNFRMGVLLRRTRQAGVLFGTLSGECRLKYLSLDAEVQEGDVVETAGFGGLFPKGLLVGRIEKIWREPGQVYQTARVKPLADPSRLEEVICVE